MLKRQRRPAFERLVVERLRYETEVIMSHHGRL